MKERLLKEKGGVKVYVIIIVVLVVLCVAIGAFAIINMNKDNDEENDDTSKKNETNTSQSEESDKKNKDSKSSDTKKYTAVLDMEEMTGDDSFEGMTWEISIEGNDDYLKEMVITVDLGTYLESIYESAGEEDSGYTYDEFLEEMKSAMDSEMEDLGESFAESMGIDASDVDVTLDWVEDDVIEIVIDLSGIDKSEYDVDDDESLIEVMVENLENEGIEVEEE